MSTLENLWDELIDIGYNVRSQIQNGMAAWQPYKSKYANFNLEGYETGIPIKESFVKLMESMKYKFNDTIEQTDVKLEINGQIFDNTIETNHFLVQHFRIPKLEKYRLSVVKVLQLAYNVGQLKAVFENENIYGGNLKKIYYKHHLDDISTYIPDDAINRHLVEKIPVQKGGFYYQKYLKYKIKYMTLKHNY